MNLYYKDILAQVAVAPVWFDEHAVPRFCQFSPDEVANIYADEVALVLISCQACGEEFKVAFSDSRFSISKLIFERYIGRKITTLGASIKTKCIHYGDPPNMQCCAAGPTMNCDDLRVLEYWKHPPFKEWVRVPRFEIKLGDKSHG
jgi:hypothetical protein